MSLDDHINPDSLERNLSHEKPNDNELLSDEAALDVLKALSRTCHYCDKEMPKPWGCDGCHPIRTREFVENDSDLANVLGEYSGYGGYETYCLGIPYGPDTCGDFADYLEGKAAESDDGEESISRERIEEIRKGAELTPEETEEYVLSQEHRLFLPGVAFVSIDDEKGETLYFVVELENQGKGYSWETASGPYTEEEFDKLRESYEADEWWT